MEPVMRDAEGLIVGSHSDLRVMTPERQSSVASSFVSTAESAAESTAASSSSADTAREVEVRWMASGEVVCSVTVELTANISEVKQLIQAQAGIPIEDQRLHLDGRELSGDAALPGLLTAPLLLVCSVCDPCITNLAHFRMQTEFEALPQGAFRLVRKLADGIHGDVCLYSWHNEHVAVKKVRSQALRAVEGTETDERVVHTQPLARAPPGEDAATEIGVLSYLSRQADACPYVLRMRGVFAQDNFTWLVTDFADGGDLFDVAAAGRVREDRLKCYMFELFQGVQHLHKHHIGHRDISLENILLKDGSVRLMDFGMSVCSHSTSGVPLRFFRAVGKDSYRPAEVYCPTTEKARITVPRTCAPGSVAMVKTSLNYLCEVKVPSDVMPGQSCMADVWGYAAQPADVFSCGVACFTLAWQCPPWRMARLNDQMFAFVHAQGGGAGLEALLRHWNLPLLSADGMNFLKQAMEIDPARRPTAAACLDSAWLAPLGEAAAATEGAAR